MHSRWIWAAFFAAVAFVSQPALAEDDDEEGEEAPAAAEADEGPNRAASVFDFLVAEVSAQRGDFEAAFAIYQRLARELRDPQVARRAVELAVRLRAFGPAMQNAALLLELEPDSAL